MKIKQIIFSFLFILTSFLLVGCSKEELKEFKDITYENLEVTYDGLAHKLEVKGELPEGTEVIYTNNEHTNVGSYEAIATLKKSGYQDLSLEATLTIKPQVIAEVKFENKEITYDGEYHDLLIEGELPQGVSVTYVNNHHKEVGKYYVTAILDASNNFEYPKMITKELVIKALTFGDLKLASKEVTYDGLSHSLEVEGELPETAEVTYYNNAQTHAGNYKVVAVISAPGYETKTLESTLTIKKAAIEGFELANQEIVYDGFAHSLTLAKELPYGYSVIYQNNDKVNAGTYTITAIIIDNLGNHENKILTANLTIKKKVLENPQFMDKEVTYNKQAHSILITSELPEAILVTYKNNNQTEVGTYTIEVNFIDRSGNYEIIDKLTATLTINPQEEGVYTMNDLTVIYDGKKHSLQINEELPEGVTITYENNDQVNAGTYEVTATLNTPQGEIIVKATLTINKAIFKDLELTSKSFTYDGTVKNLVLTGSLPEGSEVKYTNNDQTNAGNYEVTAVVSNPNYEDLTLKADLTINKAQFEGITLTSKEFIYNGYIQRIVLDGLIPEGTDIKYVNNAQKEIGTYAVTATLTNQNYETLVLTATLTIKKDVDDGNLKFIDNVFKYDGKAHSLAVSNLPEGLFVTYVNNNHSACGRYEVVAIISNMQGKVMELKAILTISMDGLPLPEEDVYTLEINGKSYTLKQNVANLNEYMASEISVKAGDKIVIKKNGRAINARGKSGNGNNVTGPLVVRKTVTNASAYFDVSINGLWLTGF